MIDWNEVGYPGTSVFDGMTAAANWNTRALANVDAVNKLREWHLDTNLRKAARDVKEDELLTAAEIGARANKNLRTISKFNNELYHGKDGMMKALDAIDPLGGGAFRRLSSDGKTIETVSVDGSVINTQPNYTGKTAERALLQNYGLGALMEREQFFPRERFEQGLNAQLALQRDATAAELEKWKMQVLLGGLRGLGGGRGGSGGGSGSDNPKDPKSPWSKVNYMDFLNALDREAAVAIGAPITEKGQPDFMNMTPEQKQQFDSARMIIHNNAMQGLYSGRGWDYGQSLYNGVNLFRLGLDEANRKVWGDRFLGILYGPGRQPRGASSPVTGLPTEIPFTNNPVYPGGIMHSPLGLPAIGAGTYLDRFRNTSVSPYPLF